ncbi:DUF2889 domain-containing protein [Novosphingobium sp. 9U]|uniref:DUF2889 domain-containing protein n=1 Tax=Novosphingobium sp. 9U TaxID=2653158 RepID=UPI0012EF22DF|nr:DUF2889 domain-containing protein [Novosphingobium sp. 9U]VWX53382.1 conserved hypothetical protein [Novosphingobium sp. 9U]
MATTIYPPPPRSTANPAPTRPANSMRRTSSIDVAWPDGPEAPRRMVGRARDMRTDYRGDGEVLAEGSFRLRMTEDKTVIAIEADPPQAGIDTLVGERGGGHLRMVLRERLPQLIARNDPLYLVLDDISGTALVSAFAWSQWYPDWVEKLRARMGEETMARMMEQRINVCWGLQEGNTGVRPEGPPNNVADADAGELRNPADPDGWHAFHDEDGPGFRRARRIDVVRDEAAGQLRIDSAFQDSAKLREGGRVAIHEYLLRATCDLDTLEILTLEPEARILPFSECPGAIHNTGRLIGKRLDAIRAEVLAQLRGPEGCTHLNDALRALADVPALAEGLRELA